MLHNLTYIFVCIVSICFPNKSLHIINFPDNHLPSSYITTNEQMQFYYVPSPSLFMGYATRSGPLESNIHELRKEISFMMEQSKYAFPLIGGGYGLHNGIWIRNSTDLSKWLVTNNPANVQWNNQQLRLKYLGSLDDTKFENYIHNNYVGVISIKSPNDIGREYCIYDYWDRTYIGKVIVGGTAALNDWTQIGKSKSDLSGAGRLGIRRLYLNNEIFWWAAELPDNLFYLIKKGDSALVILDETCSL